MNENIQTVTTVMIYTDPIRKRNKEGMATLKYFIKKDNKVESWVVEFIDKEGRYVRRIAIGESSKKKYVADFNYEVSGTMEVFANSESEAMDTAENILYEEGLDNEFVYNITNREYISSSAKEIK